MRSTEPIDVPPYLWTIRDIYLILWLGSLPEAAGRQSSLV